MNNKKQYRIRYYFEVMQEGFIEAESLDRARELAEAEVASWGWDWPRLEFVDSPNNDIEVTEVE